MVIWVLSLLGVCVWGNIYKIFYVFLLVFNIENPIWGIERSWNLTARKQGLLPTFTDNINTCVPFGLISYFTSASMSSFVICKWYTELFCELHEIMCQESSRKLVILHLYFPQPRTHLLWSKSSSLWPYFYRKLVIAPLSDIPLFTKILKTKSTLISPCCTFIKLLTLEFKFYIPSPTQSMLDNEIETSYYDLYGLKLLPTTVSPIGLLLFDWSTWEPLPEMFSWLDILQVSGLQLLSLLKTFKRKHGFTCVFMDWIVFLAQFLCWMLNL